MNKVSRETRRTVATLAAALILGCAGGAVTSDLHPGPRGPVGATGPQGIASQISTPQVNCALVEKQEPTTGSVVIPIPAGPSNGVFVPISGTAYLTVDCAAS